MLFLDLLSHFNPLLSYALWSLSAWHPSAFPLPCWAKLPDQASASGCQLSPLLHLQNLCAVSSITLFVRHFTPLANSWPLHFMGISCRTHCRIFCFSTAIKWKNEHWPVRIHWMSPAGRHRKERERTWIRELAKDILITLVHKHKRTESLSQIISKLVLHSRWWQFHLVWSKGSNCVKCQILP